jgi:hypothetical protein
MRPALVSSVVLVAAVMLIGCDAIHFMDRKRTIAIPCRRPTTQYLNNAASIFDQHGFTVVERNDNEGVIVAQDSLEELEYRYTALVRTWRIQHTGDSLYVDVYSVSTRLDGSDVTQTWDKKWSGETVKAWMRPILSSLESSCGGATPLGRP